MPVSVVGHQWREPGNEKLLPQIPGMYVSVLLSQHTSLAILNQSSAAPFRL